MNIDYIKQKLNAMHDRPERISLNKSSIHLNSVIPESEIVLIETAAQTKLPSDYREFISTIGNGGTGPFYGLLSIQESMVDFKIDGKPAIHLDVEFPYTNSWNDSWISEIDWDEGDRPCDEQLAAYMDVKHISGCLQICHYGHGCTYLLVVNGAEHGNIWIDERADYGGLTPLLSTSGLKTTFEEWYISWLNEILP